MRKTSEISGFYKLSMSERLRLVKGFARLSDEEVNLIRKPSSLPFELADRMIENVVGSFPMPLGIAVNFLINKKDYLIPMVTEEPSVVAAASYAAKMARAGGGFFASSTDPIMIGQVQAVGVKNTESARLAVLGAKQKILDEANKQDPILVSLGGGAKYLSAKIVASDSGPMLITELHVDCRDAMGANAVNTMSEAVAPLIEEITGGRVYLRIISNLATERLARARVVVPKDAVGGEETLNGILEAYHFAAADPYRAVTHNKGILNGVISVVLATCNDHRAVEAGAHAYAAMSGCYKPLSSWEKNVDGDLSGSIELPMAVGIVGGATKVHPLAKVVTKILGVETAKELSEVLAAVGLAQNLAALRALADEGIQRGHMALHARNIAVSAGATGKLIELVVKRMVAERKIRLDRAAELVEEYRKAERVEE